MIHTDTKILSLAAALLLCFGTYALAAPPEGKGGGKGGKGNQPIAATALFFPVHGEIVEIQSNLPLQGEFIDNGDFDTVAGQLDPDAVEILTVSGDAGEALAVLDSRHAILPDGAVVSPPGCEIEKAIICTVDFYSGVTWTIRLDRDKQYRVQFKMRWLNAAGFEHHLRIGWVVQAYDDIEIYPLDTDDYGVSSSDSLKSAVIKFESDPFRIDGKVPTGKGKKTELEVFSRYGEVNSDSAPWCNMGNAGRCLASTTITTTL